MTPQRPVLSRVAVLMPVPEVEERTTPPLRVVPARLPRPIRGSRRRKEVVLRPARPLDAAACATLDGRSSTTHVWQLDTRQDGDELRVSFRQVRLPRELPLDAPHYPPAARAGALPRGLYWVVAEEVDAAPDRGSPGTIVGYAVVAAGDASAYLRTLVVDRKHRRKGIASRLLAAAQRWAAGQGADGLMADVPARNYPALRLLQKAGLTFCGFNDRCYPDGEVALFFSCRLP